MIKFFRRIRQKLLSESKFSKYVLYAIGEIILVVIGILIALQINNWNEDKKNKRTEESLLVELKSNLQVNEERLIESIEDEKTTVKSIYFVVDFLENKRAYNDSMDYHFGRADFASDIVLSTTAFEAIKSRGFEIISSDEIRKSIIDLFDAEYGNLIAQTIRLENQFWPSASLPYFHKHFRIAQMDKRTFKESGFGAKPIDYEALLKDEVYINMIKHRGSFRFIGIEFKRTALEKTQLLKEQIANYLDQNELQE